MNDSFTEAFTQLIGNEGGYTVDSGGATMYGVTEAVARANGYTGDMHNLTLEQARAIAKAKYWDVYYCDQFEKHVAFQVFDAAYNGGNPITWLQVAAVTLVDGIMGPNTIAAVNATDPLKIILRFDAQRLKYLADLKTWPTYGKGWVNRIATNMLIATI
jgi:lysozyme family protein